MKQIPIALLDHLRQDATTTCTLVKINCTGIFAGVVLGFTSLDTAIDYDDGTGVVTYAPDYGFTPSAFQSSNDTAVDNAEVIGFVLDSGITEQMVRAGLFNYAEVTAYRVNYMNPAAGHEVLFTGTCGETTFGENSWKTEFRSIVQRAAQKMSTPYSLTCRARFGDERCGMPFTWVNGTVDAPHPVDARRGFTCAALTEAGGWYQYGVVEWLTGDNAGYQMEVFASEPGLVQLQLAMPYPIKEGDTFRIRRDCLKTWQACEAYSNTPRFRGEPLIPITGDGLYSFSAPKVDTNYGSLIGAVIGAIIGYFFGATQQGAQIGSAIGGLILPDTTVGPRLSDASRQTNSVTSQIPHGYGRFTVAGNVIEAGASVEETKKKKNFLGITTSKTYIYKRSFKIALCEGPIAGVLHIKRDGKLFYSTMPLPEAVYTMLVQDGKLRPSEIARGAVESFTGLADLVANRGAGDAVSFYEHVESIAGNDAWLYHPTENQYYSVMVLMGMNAQLEAAKELGATKDNPSVVIFTGTEEQEHYALPGINTGGVNAAYKGLAFVAFKDYDVTELGGAIPQFEFLIDATPPDVYLTSPPYVLEYEESLTVGCATASAEMRDIYSEFAAAPEQNAVAASLESVTLRPLRRDLFPEPEEVAVAPSIASITLRDIRKDLALDPPEMIAVAPSLASIRLDVVRIDAAPGTEPISVAPSLVGVTLSVP